MKTITMFIICFLASACYVYTFSHRVRMCTHQAIPQNSEILASVIGKVVVYISCSSQGCLNNLGSDIQPHAPGATAANDFTRSLARTEERGGHVSG